MKRYIKTSELPKKYYVIRTTKHGVEYKRTKTLDYWSKTPDGCWQYSKQGAKNVADKYNTMVNPKNEPWHGVGVHYSIKEVIEDDNGGFEE